METDAPREERSSASERPYSQSAERQSGPIAPGLPAASTSVELSELRPAVPTGEHGSNHLDTHQAGAAGDATGTTETDPMGKNLPPVPNPSDAPADDSGIGPATDRPTAVATAPSTGPRLIITLLLHSTETRHPYTINESYLTRRNVGVLDNNPVNMSVYTLKELIWRDWRAEWEPRPSSPSAIRLIHMGRLLDDNTNLKDSRFSIGDTPHVVHMTVKPQEAVDDEDTRIAKGGRERDGTERTLRCRCTVM